MKIALIKEDVVQDGSYLIEFLFSKRLCLSCPDKKKLLGKCLEKSNRMAICKDIS